VALAGLLGACVGDAAREADRPFTGGVARVERVVVELVSTRPPRLRVDVEGTLPDPCTEIDRVDMRSLGARVEITLETRRPFGATCVPAPTPFTRSIPLMLEGEHRLVVVDVNGVSGSVMLPPDDETSPFDRHPFD
jgi:inhibitor of cysteine peptidase